MKRTAVKVAPSNRWLWVAGILLLLGAVVGLVYYALILTTKTTIKITKGRPGAASQWEVSVETGAAASLLELKEGASIPADTWRRMNGTVTSFTVKVCGEDPVSVMELRYRTTDAAGKENDVQLEGKIGQHPAWDFADCDDPNKDCVLPARYFDPVVYPEGEKECPKPDQDVVWAMELK